MLCHSHPAGQGHQFSVQDIRTLHLWGIPGLLLFGQKFRRDRYYNPKGFSPLIGRPWRDVESNCFTTVNSYYRQKGFNLEKATIDAARSMGVRMMDRFDFSSLPQSLAHAIASKAMVPVGDRASWLGEVREGDLLAFTPSHGWPAHVGIMYNLERNQFLHHVMGKESALDDFDEHWRNSLDGVYRPPASAVHNG